LIGETISGFRITAKLGEGGMGEVYRAEDTRLGREVAVKVLPETLSAEAERLARFEREARLLASLNHPNVASIHQILEVESKQLLVMELVEGDDLAIRLRGNPLPPDEAYRVALGIARGLEAAHAKGIIHRDLKPANVRCGPDGEVKILDFGLAKALPSTSEDVSDSAATEQMTADGVVLGTPAYMSPEQVRGAEADQRSDIWSFGVILYEMLAGGRLFQKMTVGETLAAVLGSVIDLSRLPAGTPPEVVRLVRRCLERDPGKRLHAIADARIDLEEFTQPTSSAMSASSTSTAATPETSVIRTGLGRTAGVAGALVLLAIVAVFLGYRLWDQGQPETTDRSIAVLPFETLGRDETSIFTEGIHGDMLTRLSKVADLRVTSRTSVMQFRGSRESLPEIARQLGVTWLLQGEVEEVGDRVRVNARLVNAFQDRQVWAESYVRELTAEDLFAIQGELTRQIVDQLQAQLSPAEERAVGGAPTSNLDAYRLYVQGRALLEQRTQEELERTVTYFRKAIDRDPGYALAWAGLADALSLQGFYNYSPLEVVLPEAEAAARRALELETDLAEAHASLGIVQSLARQGPAAVERLERSVELNPSYGEAYAFLGWAEDLLGRPERALGPARRSVEVNPLAPAYRIYLAEAQLANGQYEQALGQARRAREIQSDYALAHFMEGVVLLHLDRAAEARTSLEKALDLALPQGTPAHSEIRAALAIAHAADGDLSAARQQLSMIDATEDPFAAGLAHAALGESERALTLFAAVEQWGYTSTPQIRYFFPRQLGPLRQDPRFAEVLRRVDRSFGMLSP
jgi:TolB-like protein/Flp pilus assembly protein TadD